jgi:S-adenosylmethionine synthetase
MIEKVNPQHPDKIADRIAGAIIDLAYTKNDNPKIAVEVLIGHGNCNIIAEGSVEITEKEVLKITDRLAEGTNLNYVSVPQDVNLANNQKNKIKAGDNGIFKGVPIDDEVLELSEIARDIYNVYQTDGKYILDKDSKRLIICQSKATSEEVLSSFTNKYKCIINPLGYWDGGINVDSGATNRKLGSDMGRALTGGGLHGKDLSKADVSVNIYAHLKAQEENRVVDIFCAIGDDNVDGLCYNDIIEIARDYIKRIGGFEKFAEWGLV